jgi:hypothetical protein
LRPRSQLRTLVEMRGTSDKHKELQEIIREFRDDEMHHHDIGIENDAEKVQRLGWRRGGGGLAGAHPCCFLASVAYTQTLVA